MAALAEALAASRERWIETMEQGRALARTVSALTGRDIPPLPYPVALGVAARGLGLAPERVAALYLQAFATTLVLGRGPVRAAGADRGAADAGGACSR